MSESARASLRFILLLCFVVAAGYGMARLGHPNSQWFYCTMLRWC